MGSYRELKVWQKSIDLVADVYAAIKTLPDEEKFDLWRQMRRAAVSISSNIAEGQGRSTSKDYRNFLIHARGSLLELETQVVICGRLGYIAANECQRLRAKTQEIGRMLNGLLRYLTPDA
jgi:four helix bundle protein